jgi:hypothetical protein
LGHWYPYGIPQYNGNCDLSISVGFVIATLEKKIPLTILNEISFDAFISKNSRLLRDFKLHSLDTHSERVFSGSNEWDPGLARAIRIKGFVYKTYMIDSNIQQIIVAPFFQVNARTNNYSHLELDFESRPNYRMSVAGAGISPPGF